jgi:flagellar basal-body rod modification protein FlgD
MATTPTAATSNATAPAVATNTALGRTRLAENFDTFLSLLTTQLKNQDPLSPLDSNQFTQQLVAMSGVEQQLLSNDLLTQLVGNSSNGVATAVSLIGKEVRAVSDTNAISGGKAEWTYRLDTAAADVKLEILDSTGHLVHAEAATNNSAGEHAISWNGKDMSGNQLANGGVYTLRVTAKGSDGATVPSVTYIKGLVTGVEQTDGQTLLSMNGGQVAWDRVTSIYGAPAAPAPAPAAP